MNKPNGIFVISLDFELYWGVRDRKTLESYKENLLGVRSVIPRLLELFEEYSIHATWATVGFLFFENRDELLRGLPVKKPAYVNSKLCPYEEIHQIGWNEEEDPFHYAPSWIRLISSFPYQEIGSHTFSHYYCLEQGQDIEAFKDDLSAAIKAAGNYSLELKSLVFPRNQFNGEYLSVCKEMGIKAYRGNENSWIYRPRSREEESLLRRVLRFIDAYVNISGHNSYSMGTLGSTLPCNIPSSRFLRPYSHRLKVLEPLRLRRILSDLTYAARRRWIYHLWWHPHNFGIHLEENLSFLRKILDHFLSLKEAYGMESLNMGELAQRRLDDSLAYEN
ncbi:MAG TPA: polysaccharide deacetylase family protein [Candidatus Limnocylindrales bacterium]|nr:polysaccharide deacetylase family protein [Candidatus Limnocylindrales bacterium]